MLMLNHHSHMRNYAAQPPFLYELGPERARQVLDDIQSAPIDKPPVQEKWITVPAEVGDVRVRVVRPVGAKEELPASPEARYNGTSTTS